MGYGHEGRVALRGKMACGSNFNELEVWWLVKYGGD